MALTVEPLDARRHDRAGFTCGEPVLDTYLQKWATQHHRRGISTTHVLVDDTTPSRVLGYYSLSAAQLQFEELQPEDRRQLPRYPVPAARMGRLAVAIAVQGQGHGEYLLAHATARCLELRTTLGLKALLVDALHPAAARFYRAYGFRPSTHEPLTLYLPLGSD